MQTFQHARYSWVHGLLHRSRCSFCRQQHTRPPYCDKTDKSGSNLAALETLNAQRDMPIRIRQNKYLNNIVEQDHRAIKRRTRPMLGFKTFRCARILLGGIELMHMIKKGQMKGSSQTPAEQFYSLAK
jgi:putative transposase